jgi:outer membrane receptor for ferrienterochelin and colicin
LTDRIEAKVIADIHNDTWSNDADATPSLNDNTFGGAEIDIRYTSDWGTLSERSYLNYSRSKNTVVPTSLVTGNTSTRFGAGVDYILPLFEKNGVAKLGGEFTHNYADVDYDKTVVEMTSVGIGTVPVRNSDGTYTNRQVDLYSGIYGSKSIDYSLNNGALYAQYEHTFFDRITAIVGARLDFHETYCTIFSPKGGLAIELFRIDEYATSLKMNYGRGFRAPTLVGVHSQSIGGYGNPDMKPEICNSIDLSLFQRLAEWGYAEVSWYRMNVQDLMVNDKLGSTGWGNYVIVPGTEKLDTMSFQQRKNLGSYSPNGVEFSMKVQPLEFLSLSGSYTYLNPEDFTFQTSRNRYNISLALCHQIGPVLAQAEVLHSYTGSGYFFDYEKQPFDAFRLTDVTVSFSYLDARVSLVGKNLGDVKFKLWHYAWQPGRTYAVRVEYSIY